MQVDGESAIRAISAMYARVCCPDVGPGAGAVAAVAAWPLVASFRLLHGVSRELVSDTLSASQALRKWVGLHGH